MDFLDELEEMIDEEHGFADGQGILEGELELRVRKGCQLPPLQSDVVLKKEPGYAVNVFDTDGNLIGGLGRIGREIGAHDGSGLSGSRGGKAREK